jgi:hypothetical protein
MWYNYYTILYYTIYIIFIFLPQYILGMVKRADQTLAD